VSSSHASAARRRRGRFLRARSRGQCRLLASFIATSRAKTRARSMAMVPGKSYDIEIALPADHTRGTYWYHPHHQRVRLVAIEEWTIRNTHEHDDHMFHIHTNPFQVVEIAGQPQADQPWRDTAVVPRPAKGGALSSARGSSTIPASSCCTVT
jgi:multicopper oxidase